MKLQQKELLFKKYEDLLQLKKQQLHNLNPKHKTIENTNIRTSLQNIYDYLAKERYGVTDLQKIADEIAFLQ